MSFSTSGVEFELKLLALSARLYIASINGLSSLNYFNISSLALSVSNSLCVAVVRARIYVCVRKIELLEVPES